MNNKSVYFGMIIALLLSGSGCGGTDHFSFFKRSSSVDPQSLKQSTNLDPTEAPEQAPSSSDAPQQPNAAIPSHYSCGESIKNQVEICHVPPGNPAAAHTICVSLEGAIHGHGIRFDGQIGGHGGDYPGKCNSSEGSSPSPSSSPNPGVGSNGGAVGI